MLNFNFYMPTRLIFGTGSLNDLGTTPFLPQGSQAMIVIGNGGAMLRHGYLARVQGLLSQNGVASMVFDKIQSNPESCHVDEAAQLCQKNNIDFLIGLGGGSAIDSAKAIALTAANTGNYWDYVHGGSGGKKKTSKPALPIVAIPTTAGTGTEVDPWTVISKTGAQEKIGFGNDSTFPTLSIVDPELMLTVPAKVTAHTGMDAFFHAVESFLNLKRQPTNDMLALEAVHLISHYLPELLADPENLELRTIIAWASTAAGFCESIGGCISHHALEHALSAVNPELPHGLGLTMLCLPYFTRLTELAPKRFDDLVAAMGFEEVDELSQKEQAHAFLFALNRLIEAVGLSEEKLEHYGFAKEQASKLTDIAFDTMGGLFKCTPGDMSKTDVKNIFIQAIEEC